jgi:uncharacterized membrane protein
MAESLQTAAGTTSTGMAPNVAAALSYVFSPVGGIVMFVIEKENAFVRAHAIQSIGLGAAIIGLSIVVDIVLAIVGFIPVLGLIAAVVAIPVWFAIGIGGLALWVMAIMKAYNGQEYDIPVIGPQARKLLAGVAGPQA